jgi:hypothetical protein
LKPSEGEGLVAIVAKGDGAGYVSYRRCNKQKCRAVSHQSPKVSPNPISDSVKANKPLA